MSKQLTYFMRAARSVTALSLCMAGAALPGCFTVDEAEPECSKDNDCDADEICTEDEECESACGVLCQTLVRCGTSSTDQASCADGCDLVREAVNDYNCSDSIAALANCFDDQSSCADSDSECAEEGSAFTTYCTLTCPFTNDGECDEPDICPAGSDVNDCAASGG